MTKTFYELLEYEEDKEVYLSGYHQATLDTIVLLQDTDVLEYFESVTAYNMFYGKIMRMKGNAND